MAVFCGLEQGPAVAALSVVVKKDVHCGHVAICGRFSERSGNNMTVGRRVVSLLGPFL